MPSSIHGSLPPRHKSTSPATNAHDDDAGLTQSLSQLSITNEFNQSKLPSSRRASTASNTPLRPPPHRSPSATPRPRNPSRSPSNGSNSRGGSRAGTPPLLRKASMNSLHSASGAASGKSLTRRASYGQLMSLTSSKSTTEEEKAPVTANSIASDYFRAELEAHHGLIATLSTDTIVILNDAVYGHRFSRPRTSRSALSTIVERPERIKACVLGVSTAYVRLGGRHCQGRLPIHPKRNLLDIDGIPFRIHKTTRRLPLSSPAVTNVHGTKWMEELKLMCESAESTLAMGRKELQRRDVAGGADDPVPQQLHEGDLYLCAESLNAMEGALGAVCEAVDTVFGDGPRRAFVGVRPPGHHCSASHPSGFCWVNNVHVGIMHGALHHELTHAAIIDFDLHHGDGSQAITWEHNSRAGAAKKNEAHWKKTSIGYFSLHDINSYPCEWGDAEKVRNASVCVDNAHGQSIWNVHLQSWKTEQDFWALYESTYSVLLDKTRKYLRERALKVRDTNQTPKAAIFFSAGFDASEWEGAGMQRHQVNVPTEFYARLTRDVVKLAAEDGLAVDGRVISVLEGGYSDRALHSGILSHLSGMVGKSEPSIIKTEQEDSGLGYEMDQRTGLVNMDVGHVIEPTPSRMSICPYNPSWWASGQLDQLEQAAEPPSPPKKARNSTPPTYSSPTQASTARVTDPVKMRRSLSSLSTGQPRVIQRPPSPPPPEVSWVVAAKELCNILIPLDRQTDSYKAEELNAEASRARRDRQSILLGLPPPPPPPPPGADRSSSRMSLRERRARTIGPIDEETSETLPRTRRKPVTTPVASPMKTIRSTPQPNVTQSARRSTRRLSAASTTLSPPSEEESLSMPPVPATAPAPRRTTTSRPNSRAGNAQSGGKVPLQKNRGAPVRKEAAANGPRTVKKTSTPARAGKQPALVGADTPTPCTGLPLSVAGNDANADMDNLAMGVKKIRINLITQSQKEAKMKTKYVATDSAAGGRGVDHDSATVNSEKTPTPECMSSIPTVLVGPSALPASCASEPLQAQAQAQAPPTPSLSGGRVPTPVEALYTSSGTSSPTPAPSLLAGSSPNVPHVAIHAASDTSDMFIPYQPEGSEAVAVTLVPQEPLKWLPPNVPAPSASTPTGTGTPAPVAKPSGLFKYQHNSGIPFAPRADKPAHNTSGTG